MKICLFASLFFLAVNGYNAFAQNAKANWPIKISRLTIRGTGWKELTPSGMTNHGPRRKWPI